MTLVIRRWPGMRPLRTREALELVALGDRGGTARGGENALLGELTEDTDRGFNGRVGHFGQLLLRQRDRLGVKLLRERKQGLGQPPLDRIVDHAAFFLDPPQAVAEQTQRSLEEI